MTEDTALKFVGAHPPAFSTDDALYICHEHFGVSGDAEPLWGERDQNFRITSDDHAGYVLKISNAREEARALDFQTRALKHLRHNMPSLSVPEIRPLISGQPFGQFTGEDGTEHLIHMVSLLEGVTLANATLDHTCLYAAGAQAGDAAVGLRGFFHAAAGDEMFWDVRLLGKYTPYVRHIADTGFRKSVQDFMASFCQDILPALNSLRSQVVHYDTNLTNVLVDPTNPGRVTGLIDFGDMIHASIAQDVAVAAAETTREEVGVLDGITAVVSGYDKTCPLEETEIDLIYDLVVARHVLGILIGITRNLNGITSENDFEYAELYGPPLEALLSIGREKTRKTVRSVCRFSEYCPPAMLPAGTNKTITDDLIGRRQKVLGTALPLTYDTPVHTVRGEGVWLYDIDGRAFLDCYNNVPHVGHCHPHVVKALSRQASALNTNSRYMFESIIEYAERLAGTMPGDLGACLFVNSGSEANDIALRMAKECSGQDGALIVDGAYHGITNEIYALSPSAEWGLHASSEHGSPGNAHASELRSDIQMVENPDTVRGRFNADDSDAGEKYAADADRAINQLKQDGHPVGAFMVDSAFSTHGILNVPSGYVEGVSKRVRDAGGMIIGDEVQSGFGRLGDHMWGFESHGITPDFVTLGKPIGNGIALGVVVTTPEILEQFTRTKEFFSTFGGNPVACAAAMAVMDVMENENLMENARDTGAYLRDGLRAAGADSAAIGDVRGRGLFIGVDVVSDRNSMAPDPREASRIKNHLRDNGFLVGSDGIGDNILKIRPPMVFRREHADLLIEAFGKAVAG
jgi:4-aminobutyrate aminotransferase-like enzyme/Ser/Thr protein kinase RdoA (MazF antagonist)